MQGGKFEGGADYARESHYEMLRVQAEKLQLYEEQEERPRSSRDEEVLQILQEAHCPQRDEVIALSSFSMQKG